MTKRTIAGLIAIALLLPPLAIWGDEQSHLDIKPREPYRHVISSTFVVNSANDVDDGSCDGTHCSLREAINAANSNPGLDLISFDIPGVGPHTIWPRSALPSMTDPVVIDGFTQPGASPNTNPPGVGTNAVLKVVLDGTLAGSFFTDGLQFTGGNSTLRGLVVSNFGRAGVVLSSADSNVVEGNFIGVDAAGTRLMRNGNHGVYVSSSSGNLVGGATPGSRNVISGNLGSGIRITGGSGDVIQGNFIGTDATGTVAIPNQFDGIEASGSNHLIGGTSPGAGNLLSGNGSFSGAGIELHGNDNVVQGNLIGTDITGTLPLGNSFNGVYANGAIDCMIGGTTPEAGNIIAFNRGNHLGQGGDGVMITSATGNAVLANSIFSNEDIGIDLDNIVSESGVSLNDLGDADTGPNNMQNYPVLSSATDRGNIVGTLNSAPNTAFRIEFFWNGACSPSGHGEGENYLGWIDVTTDGSGDAAIAANLAASIPVGAYVTATATDPGYNTSEFSACVEAEASPVVLGHLDITPGSCPNPLNLNPFGTSSSMVKPKIGGVLPVAVLGTEEFDVRSIDASTLLLEGVAPIRSGLEDVASPIVDVDSGADKERDSFTRQNSAVSDSDAESCPCTSDGPDGYMDLTLKFQRSEIAAALGSPDLGEVISLTLTGELTDGTPFEAVDCVTIVGGPRVATPSPERFVPTTFALHQNIPNPFNPTTTIRYDVARGGGKVTLQIFDVSGRLVRTLVDGDQSEGQKRASWDGQNNEGRPVATGTYFYRLTAPGFNQTKKMVLLK